MKLNTNLCVDLKTLLLCDVLLKIGKDYNGVLTRDGEEHYEFVETGTVSAKRNSQVFAGKHITITQRDDGSLRPNFKPLKVTDDFNIDTYAIEVCNELREAMPSLLEK